MSMMTVFDPSGGPHVVESVDAREYLRSGYYTTEPPEPKAAISEPAVESDSTPAPVDTASEQAPETAASEPAVVSKQAMTVAEIREALIAKGIEFDQSMGKRALRAMLEAS